MEYFKFGVLISAYTDFILFSANNGNDVLSIVPYCYIFLLDSCLYFEHVKSSHLESHVRSSVRICISYRCQSSLDTLCRLQTQKCGGDY